MASLIRLGITALLVLGVAVGNAGVGWAGVIVPSFTVKIDDLTETPTVTVFEGPNDVTSQVLTFQSNNNPAGEFLHFTLPLTVDPTVSSAYSDLFEDHLGGTLSDRLVLTVSDLSLDVQFASDPASVAIPPGAIHGLDFVENGDFQTLFIVEVTGPGSTPAATGPVSYEFQVRSDVEVPAPATLFLVASGLAGLGALGWRRRRG